MANRQQYLALRGHQAIEPDALTWKRAVGAPGVSDPQLKRLSKLIHHLKACGVWPLLERLHIAGENFIHFNVCLVSRASGTNNGATFTALQGIAGNGSSAYWDSGFNSSTGTKFTQNSGHLSVWQRAVASVGSAGIHGNVNTDAGTNGVYVDFSVGAGFATSRINASSGAAQTITGGIGHLLGNRTASNVADTWYNGSKGTTNSTASQTPQNLTLWIGGRNFLGSINQASNAQVFALSIGAGLSDAQAMELYAALASCKAALNA